MTEIQKQAETALCKRVCNFASSIIAASDGVDARRAIKIAVKVILLLNENAELERKLGGSSEERVLH
jgi:hypothetical protein